MTILVKNCFNWIGFHIINHLLKEEYKISGMHSPSSMQSKHLSGFFERHSHFTLLDHFEDQTYTTALFIEETKRHKVEATRKIIITERPDEIKEIESNDIIIEQPLLFGEWMPIQSSGCFYLNELIYFDSPKFHKEAIWIHDFITIIELLLLEKNLPPIIRIKKNPNTLPSRLILDNTVHIQDNTPIESKVKDLLKHYNRFKHLY